MRNRIISFLKKRPSSTFRKRELARLMGLRQSEYRLFRGELQNLVDEGKVFRIQHGGYAFSGSAKKVQGTLVLHQKGFGFVITGGKEDIFVSSKRLRGAINGDTVETVLLPLTFGRRPEGQVTRIIRRGTTQFVGTVTVDDGLFLLEIEPVTPRRGVQVMKSSPVKCSPGDVVVADVRDWGEGRQSIKVEVVKVLGSMNNPADDMKIVCHKFNLQPEFPQTVLSECSSLNKTAIREEIPNRDDFRDIPCITIDPREARDFDDAISLEFDGDGNAVVGVHIADVSFFVPEGSQTDQEARRRGTSVYFSEGVVHMLPENLSSDLCSLVPGEDRLAVTVLISLNANGDPVRASFHSSVIRNSGRFTYREAQSVLDGNQQSTFSDLLSQMNEICLKLLKKRREKGSIDFDIPEPIFRFQNGGIPHEIYPSERLNSHRIVEEFMLLANRIVAERVPGSRSNGRPFIYRVHDIPSPQDMERFLDILRKLGLYARKTATIGSSEFRKILSDVEDSPYKSLVENLALRTMTKAIYSVENRGHFGLAFEKYTHFTSPIRRYPDLVVHRLLCSMALGRSPLKSPGSLESFSEVARESTEAEIRAMEAERDYIKLKQIRWLSQHIGEKFEGIISGVISTGFFVELSHSLVEGLVHVETLEDDYYVFSETDLSITGRRWKESYQMGKLVEVTVHGVSLEKRRADFLLVPR